MSAEIPDPAAALTRKIGPLPGWAWALIVVALAYGFYFWKKRGAAGAGTPTSPATDPAAFAPAALGFESAGPMPGTGTYNGQVNTMPVGQAAVSTNAQWAKTVGNFLIGTGSYDSAAVSNALSKYLNGGQLTDQETAIVGTAVKQYQLPPEGVLPVKTGPAFYGHKYTAQQGDTLDSILKQFYGTSDPITARIVADNNAGALAWDGTKWGAPAAGTVLKLPTNGIAGVQNNSLTTIDGVKAP